MGLSGLLAVVETLAPSRQDPKINESTLVTIIKPISEPDAKCPGLNMASTADVSGESEILLKRV